MRASKRPTCAGLLGRRRDRSALHAAGGGKARCGTRCRRALRACARCCGGRRCSRAPALPQQQCALHRAAHHDKVALLTLLTSPRYKSSCADLAGSVIRWANRWRISPRNKRTNTSHRVATPLGARLNMCCGTSCIWVCRCACCARAQGPCTARVWIACSWQMHATWSPACGISMPFARHATETCTTRSCHLFDHSLAKARA